MILEIILAVILGIVFGSFTGLFPGIHINLVSAGLLAGIGYFSGVPVLALVAFIVAMAITHTFLDFIPSVYLGAPEEDSFLAVLPGHELLRKGRGHEAVVYSLYGSLFALLIVIVLSFFFVLFLDDVFSFVEKFIPYILIFVSLYLIFKEDEVVVGLVSFLLAGFLGLFVFSLPVREPLLPLLTGLFGLSGLIISVKDKISIPKQEVKSLRKIKLSRKGFLRTVFAGFVSAPIGSFLPALGSGQAAVIGSELMGKESDDKRNFLFLVGMMNTIVMSLSFVTAYSIGKTRTGAAVAVQEILKEISLYNLFFIILICIFSGVIAFFLGVYLSKYFSKIVAKVNYGKLSLVVIALLVVVNLVLSNFLGLIVLFTSTALGVFVVLSRARRINLMGCLILPTIVYYLVG